MVAYHVRDLQIFNRDSVVARNQIVRVLVQKIFSAVGDVLMLMLIRFDCHAPVTAELGAARHPPLQNSQSLLFVAIPARVFDLLTRARGEQPMQTHIQADLGIRRGQGLRLDLAREARIPTVSLAHDP